MHRWLPTRHFSCTYTTNRPRNPLPYFFSRRQRRAAPKQKVVPLFTPSNLSGFLSFLSGMKNADIHTTFGAAYIGIIASSLYESNRFSTTKTNVVFPVAFLASFRCNVTPTTTGILWIDLSTRCWCVLDHQPGGSFSHQPLFCLIRWECYGSYSITSRLALKTHPFLRLLEAAHSILISHFFYHYVIINWGNTLAIVTQPIVWSVVLRPRYSP